MAYFYKDVRGKPSKVIFKRSINRATTRALGVHGCAPGVYVHGYSAQRVVRAFSAREYDVRSIGERGSGIAYVWYTYMCTYVGGRTYVTYVRWAPRHT
jgi:nitrous oxidase accessory protein NosD